jgi:hypothetical protein
MNFDEWWATLSPPERRVIGEFNARFVWKEAVEMCAKVCDEKVAAEYDTGKVDHNEMGWTQACAIAIRDKGNTL